MTKTQTPCPFSLKQRGPAAPTTLPGFFPNSTGFGSNQSDVATSLLTVNIRGLSRDLMIQGRPTKDKRFSGQKSQDYESFINQFELTTNLEGITDMMKYLELKHWTSGTAYLVVCQYDCEADPAEALSKAKLHLKKEFG